jgi:periplasmic divalent cation tolerance protein
MTERAEDYAVALITAGSKEQAMKIARALVEERLVACCNIVDPITSVYRWEGKICEDPEALIVAKTRAEHVERVAARVKELHTYSCPETIAIPLVAGAPWYLKWLGEST